MSINDFAIQNIMMLIRIKSMPYNPSATKENGLLATNVVRYGISEIVNSNKIFCQIILVSIFSTWLYITWWYCQMLVQTKKLIRHAKYEVLSAKIAEIDAVAG